MRLIDAEAAKEFLMENLILPDQSHEKIAETMIDAIPTAYDIDAVVRELKKIKAINVDVGYGTIYKTIRKDVAIEIVKQGGVSDDVCEYENTNDEYCKWKINSVFPETINNPHVAERENIATTKYCPYCGKKIKAVE